MSKRELNSHFCSAHNAQGSRRCEGCLRTMVEATLAETPKPGDAQDAVARLLALREQIARRARDCGRAPESIKLVAVSKTFSADEVRRSAGRDGQPRCGGDRVQEA